MVSNASTLLILQLLLSLDLFLELYLCFFLFTGDIIGVQREFGLVILDLVKEARVWLAKVVFDMGVLEDRNPYSVLSVGVLQTFLDICKYFFHILVCYQPDIDLILKVID